MGGEDVKKLSRLGYTGVVIPNCIQVETKQTSEVFKTSEVSPETDVILIAKANKNGESKSASYSGAGVAHYPPLPQERISSVGRRGVSP